MNIDIDITEKKSQEIIQILTTYPYGHLENKFERVFWVSEQSGPNIPRCSPGDSPQQGGSPTQGNKLHQGFSRMGDALGSMMGSPQRQPPQGQQPPR